MQAFIAYCYLNIPSFQVHNVSRDRQPMMKWRRTDRITKASTGSGWVGLVG